ncbi:MAG: DEAD/DEAH box helicase [Reinekea sp.]
MQRPLRQYQSDSIDQARRELLKGHKSILIQQPTGTGKTRIVAQIVHNAQKKYIPGTDQKQSIWFVVPRKELLWQSSQEFLAWGIQHGMITATRKEQPAFQVHICSKDTLLKRIKNKLIKNWPSIIIIDEAHLALKQQLTIKAHSPENTIFLGLTATPERLDGMGLNEMWKSIIFGPSLQWFIEGDYLKRPKVYSIPPVAGLENLKFNKSGDVSAKELTELYFKNSKGGMIYGDQIEHYRKYGTGRSFLVFCRSIIDAERISAEFVQSGFRVESIDGKMSDRIRKEKIDKVKTGQLDGLTTVDLVTYGLDVPKISCIIMLRPTDSVALFYQMIGRGLRPDPDFNDCLIFDHVGNCSDQKHGHPLAPRVWNFEGIERRKKPKDAIKRVDAVDKCPVCWDLIIDGKCRSCGYEPEKKVPITEPTPLKERPQENRREYEDLFNSCREAFRKDWELHGKINEQAVKNCLEAAEDVKRQPLWVYHYLNSPDMSVNFSLLMMIQKEKGYKHGWAYYKRKELEGKTA